MQHLLSPYSKEITPFAWWEGAFTTEELDWLQNLAKKAAEPAEIGGGVGHTDSKIRRSSVNWLHNNDEKLWVFNKLSHVVSSLNADFFGFSLTGFGEPLQLTNYEESNNGTYDWHQDFGSKGLSRKLSLVLQLSNSEDYEGGELQLLTKSTPTSIIKQRGLITVFPAWTLHKVTPVSKGNRQTLVAWISGEPFR